MDDLDILQEFLVESSENLARLDQEMVELEKRPRDAELLASIFRTIHTIKGTCRPAADVLFRSLAQVYQGDVLAVVLTGMGQDGLEGVRSLKSEGARTIVQDMKTRIVWGMPGAVVSAGLADQVIPLDCIANEIVRLARS